MNLNLVYKLCGYLSLVIGIAASLCIYRPGLMVFAMGFTLLGFILGSVNVFLNAKYFWQEEKFPKGYIGIFLSSLPVLFMLFMIFKSRH
jgi:hypothetical protein